jgi:hypothetical protein
MTRVVRGCLAVLLGLTVLGPTPLAADGSVVRIGILVPMEGPDQARGAAVLRGVEGAVSQWKRDHSEAAAQPSTRVIPAQLRWGAQTDALVGAVFDDRAMVIIGAADPRTAHLAAQVVTRLKGSALLVSLSRDPTLTEIGVPWILRFPAGGLPSGASQEQQGPDPSPASLETAAHDAAQAVLAAMENCGSDIDGIRTFLSAHTFHGRTGPFTFDAQGNRTTAKAK